MIREVDVTGVDGRGVVVVIRVVVGGFVVGGGVVATRVVEAGVVVVRVPETEAVELGSAGVEAVPGELGTADLLEGVPDDWTTVGETDGPVVTTDGLTVNGTGPLVPGSAAGVDEQPESSSTAPSTAPTARLLNCVMNLPDPPAEQPPSRSFLTPEITRRARTLPELSTRSTR